MHTQADRLIEGDDGLRVRSLSTFSLLRFHGLKGAFYKKNFILMGQQLSSFPEAFSAIHYYYLLLLLFVHGSLCIESAFIV